MKALWRRWQAHRESRLLQQRAIPDPLWQLTLARLPFLARRSAADLHELRRLATLFLTEKEWSGAGGLEVDDVMAVHVAAQAVLPVLRFGLAPYGGFVGIVLHADEVLARREVMDDDGVVHAYDEPLAGEAMAGGPVMLSWRDAAEAGDSAQWGYNLVVHEFAHVLDMADGQPNGMPPMADARLRADWIAQMPQAYEQLCNAVDAGQDTLLDPYGATDISEFFAVASECFFVAPNDLRAEHPDLYGLLARYYRQDPAADQTDTGVSLS